MAEQRLDSLEVFTPKGLGELLAYIEQWFNLGGKAGAAGWRFNKDNEGGWGFVRSNAATDIDYGTYGLQFADTSEHGILLVAQNAGNTLQGQVIVNDSQITLTLVPSNATAYLSTDGTFSCILDGGGP